MNTRLEGVGRIVAVVAVALCALGALVKQADAFCNACGTCDECSLRALALREKAVAAKASGPGVPKADRSLNEQVPALHGVTEVPISDTVTKRMIKIEWGTDKDSSAKLIRCYVEEQPESGVFTGDASEGLPGAGKITYTANNGDSTYVWEAGKDLRVYFNGDADPKRRYVRTTEPDGRVIHKVIRNEAGDIVGHASGDGVPDSFTETPSADPSRPLLIEHRLDAATVEKTHFNYKAWPRRKRQTVQSYNSDHGQTPSRRFLTTLYVYYAGTDPDVNKRGRLWFVVEPEGVSRYLAANGYDKGIDPASPAANCGLDDRTTVPDDGQTGLLAYAAMVYAGYDSQGRVTSYSSCSSCGGSGSYTFEYLDNSNASYPANPTEDQKFNVWKSAKRTTEPSGLRKVEFLNVYGQVVCDVTQEMDGTTIVNRWLTHTKYDTKGRAIERREVSACPISLTTDATKYYVQQSSGWTTFVTPPTSTTSQAGVSWLYVYDGDGNLTHEKVRRGLGGSTYFLRKYTYTGRTVNDRTVYHLASETTYPTETTAEIPSPDDRLTTIYSYTFYLDSHAIKTRTVTHPAVSTANNGPGSATLAVYHYRLDAASNLHWNDWTRHEDGTYAYTALGTGTYNHGKTVTSIQDANSDGVGTAYFPDGWTARTTGLHLRTTYAYYGDSQETGSPGQLKTVTFDPAGSCERKSISAYLCRRQTPAGTETTTALVTLSAPFISGGDYSLLPMSVTVSDLAGRTLAAAAGRPHSPTDGDLTNDWDPAPATLQAAFKADGQGGNQGALYRLSVNAYDNKGRLTHSDSYHAIPADGYGQAGTHYYRTTYDYDPVTARQYKATSPDGSIHWTEVDKLGRAASTWVGTNDAAATPGDPDGNGAPNNMVKLSETHYDGASACGTLAVGDGNVTLTRAFHSQAASYDNVYAYDWRNRQTASRGPDKLASRRTLDNLGRATVVETFLDANEDLALDNGEPRTQARTYYDQKGQVYRTRAYKLKTAAHSETEDDRLTTRYWYDAAGRQIKTLAPSGLMSKTAYDSAGRSVAAFTGYDDAETAYADAATVAGDTVIEQSAAVYDAAGNVLLAAAYQRTDTATKTGDLADSWAAADSRRTYVAHWYDPAGRPTHAANYGTNGNAELTRPGTPPEPNTSDDYIVTRFEYDSAGRQHRTTDNLARVTLREYDALGRTVKLVENHADGQLAETETDTDRTTLWQFDSAGRLAALVARNPLGAGNGIQDQQTRYYYGTTVTAASPAVYRNDLLAAVVYPDSNNTYSYATSSWTGDYDRVEYAYDRIGRKVASKDQRGVVHEYVFDSAGRLRADKVANASWPTGVDDYVKSITFKHDPFGRPAKITSHGNVTDDPDDTASVRNQVLYHDDSNPGYDDWGNLQQAWQAHAGAVNTSTSPKVAYYYEAGVSSGEVAHVRPDYVAYPGAGRSVYYNYPASGVGAKLSRLDNLAANGSPADADKFAAYTYLGGGTIVGVAHPAVAGWLRLDLDGEGQGTINVGDAVTDGGSASGVLMAKATSYWWVRQTGATAWAASGTITKDASNTQPYSAKADAAGLTLSYGSGGTYPGFDRFGRVVDQAWSKSAGPMIDRVEYGYDRASNRIWRDVARELPAAPAGKDELYAYDGLHRLATADRGDLNGGKTAVDNRNFAQQWTKTESDVKVAELDALGNWRKFRQATAGSTFDGAGDLTQSRTHNAVNELNAFAAGQGQAAWADPVYDAAGNMVSGPRPGQLADGATRLHFVYDAWNRLTAVWEDDGDGTLETGGQAGDDAKIAEYQYDGRNYRVVKLVAAPKSVAPAAWNRTDFYYNEGWQVLEERQARDVSPANKGVEAAAVHVQWAWDVRYIDAAVLRWRDGNLDGDLADAEDDTLYYCSDANMNVTAVVDAATGAAVERYIYDPYGRVTFLNGDWSKTLGPDQQPATADDGTASNYANEVLYCGYRFDPEWGGYSVRRRVLNPATGSWLQADLTYFDWVNLFEYVRGNPLGFVDWQGAQATQPGTTSQAGTQPEVTTQPTATQPVTTTQPRTQPDAATQPGRGTIPQWLKDRGYEPIVDAQGKAVGAKRDSQINCVGYATGLNASLYLVDGMIFRDYIAARGFNCKRLEQPADNCDCDDKSNRRIMIYVYQINPKYKLVRGQEVPRNPWEDPWVENKPPRDPERLGDDVHAALADCPSGESKWSDVPGNFMRNPVRSGSGMLIWDFPEGLPRDVTLAQLDREYHGSPRYCCCKPGFPKR